MEPRDEGDPKREKDPWNYLRGLDKLSGKTLWVSEDALTHYNTPVFGYDASHMPAILMGRGGYHEVPETPSGLTMMSLAPFKEGKTIWRYEAPGKALYNSHWDKQYAYWFSEGSYDHQVIDAATGKLLRTQSLTDKVDYRLYDPATGKHKLLKDINLKKLVPPISVFPAWFTNIVVGEWHYFLCFTDTQSKVGPPHCIGRVNVESGKVEYLELPVSVDRRANAPDRLIWGERQMTSTNNSRGIDVASDPRSKRDGWFWCMLGSPTAVEGKIYFTNMLGVIYVIDANASILNPTISIAGNLHLVPYKPLDQKALMAVNDLGTNGQTWSLNSVSYANGRLYHRSMREVVCIGTK